MAEIVQQEYVLVGWTLFYPRVNVTNTVHLSKHHSYCLQRQNRGLKDRYLECHLIADDRDKWITNSTTPQYAHIIPLCQWTQSLRVLHFFQAVYIRYLHGEPLSLRSNFRQLHDWKWIWINNHVNNNYNVLFKLIIINSITSTNTMMKKLFYKRFRHLL